ncbi:soluble NSF attachment family protein [Paraburkholderia sediminicola]|uniref:hypothetical protein n=1 Tax=Paraburkholderia sediminicola TaxID=458836 RepID=UPI0038BB57DF
MSSHISPSRRNAYTNSVLNLSADREATIRRLEKGQNIKHFIRDFTHVGGWDRVKDLFRPGSSKTKILRAVALIHIASLPGGREDLANSGILDNEIDDSGRVLLNQLTQEARSDILREPQVSSNGRVELELPEIGLLLPLTANCIYGHGGLTPKETERLLNTPLHDGRTVLAALTVSSEDTATAAISMVARVREIDRTLGENYALGIQLTELAAKVIVLDKVARARLFYLKASIYEAKAEAQKNTGKHDEAAGIYERATEAYKEARTFIDVARTSAQAVKCSQEARRLDKAPVAHERATGGRRNAGKFVDVGGWRIQVAKFDKDTQKLDKAARGYKAAAEASVSAGIAYEVLGKHDKAARAWTSAAAVHEQMRNFDRAAATHLAASSQYLRAGKDAEAADADAKAAVAYENARKPKEAAAAWLCAVVSYERAGKFVEADNAMRKLNSVVEVVPTEN